MVDQLIDMNTSESEGQQANKAPHRMLITPQWVVSFPVMKCLAAASLALPLPLKRYGRIKDSGVGCLWQKVIAGSQRGSACLNIRYQRGSGKCVSKWEACMKWTRRRLHRMAFEIRVASFWPISQGNVSRYLQETFGITSSKKHTVATAKAC